MKQNNELYINNCHYICDARPTIDAGTPPPTESSKPAKLNCPWMEAPQLGRPVKVDVATDASGKTTATCSETKLCHDLHVYVD